MRLMTLATFNLVFIAAAVLTWPIYRDFSFVVLVAVALLLSNTLALIATLRAWSARRITLVLAAAYLVVGVPLAIPSGLSDLATFFSSFLRLFTAPITAWKDLLTLSLPVASYQTVLVPALIMYLWVATVALILALGQKRRLAAAFVALLPLLFAATFGSSDTQFRATVFGATLQAPLQILLTFASVVLLGFWLSQSKTVSNSTRGSRRTLAGLTAVLTATLIALLIVPSIMAQQPREVLRTRVDPQLVIDQQTSPLSTYRAAFSDALYDTILFQVSSAPDVSRIRIAALSAFNGQVMMPADDSAFARVPALVSARELSNSAAVKVGALQGVWMPTATGLTAIEFTGDRAAALSDGFFFNTALESAVQIAEGGLAQGDAYRLVTQPPKAEKSLADLTPGLQAPTLAPEFVPESMQDWIALQKVSTTGRGLETLIDRLRARGYLSHALSIDDQLPPAWMDELPGYEFEPSQAGHSTARIEQLFSNLVERQREVGSASDPELVAAVGDDEQFAVAAWMLADQLGFNARVVLGTSLKASASQVLPACTAGACNGANLSAWLEVQDASGEWVSVDVTPQYEYPIAPDVDRLQDPQVVTEVVPPSLDSVQPAESAPSAGDDRANDDATPVDLAWLWFTLQVAGIAGLVALILLGPPLSVLFLKRRRYSSRRAVAEPKLSVLGAWNEYVDSAIDHGRPLPGTRTRSELVREYSARATSEPNVRLAEITDQAIFDEHPVSHAESASAWQLVDEHKREFAAGLNRRRKLRAALSLRSFLRWIRGAS